MARPSSPISPKVTSATVASAIATLAMSLLEQIPVVEQLPEQGKVALLVLLTGAVTFVAGYLSTDPLRALNPRQTGR